MYDDTGGVAIPIGRVMPYSGGWLDRAGGKRRDPDWLAATGPGPVPGCSRCGVTNAWSLVIHRHR